MMRPNVPTEIGPATVRTMDDLMRLLILRRHEVGFNQIDTEEAAGLASGHLAKIEAGYRGLGPVSLSTILGALGVELRVELVPVSDAHLHIPSGVSRRPRKLTKRPGRPITSLPCCRDPGRAPAP